MLIPFDFEVLEIHLYAWIIVCIITASIIVRIRESKRFETIFVLWLFSPVLMLIYLTVGLCAKTPSESLKKCIELLGIWKY